MPKNAIIGGTGVYDPKLLENIKESIQNTPYGETKVSVGYYNDEEIAFIPRHGSGHSVPPHLINYRANIWALKELGVENIMATTAVGSLHFENKPGQFVLASQFLDFTKNRYSTFFEGGEQGVTHCDMTLPYCPDLRKAIEATAKEKEFTVYNGGVYVCSEGPRFETAAEIAMFKLLGGHLIGMTSVPEVCLARELGMCYANISIVTNFAAGISPNILTHSEVLEIMRDRINDVRILMLDSLNKFNQNKECDCQKILDETGLNK